MGGTVKINHARHNEAQIGYAPSGAIVTGEPDILFDGKTLHGDPDNIWSNGGTGTVNFLDPMTELSVTAGQYQCHQSTRMMPYFAGYPMYAEFTFDTFAPEDGVTKRVGYFSTSSSAPYTANRDGFWLESANDTLYIKAAHQGTPTASIPLSKWHGYKILKDYDWDQFTAIMFDHLWLGGASLRMWVATWQHGWVLAHTVPFVGLYQSTITHSPQNYMRYEIYSTTGAGSLRANCCQFSVLGHVTGKAYAHGAFNPTSLACNSTSSIYVLQAIKKDMAAQPHLALKFVQIGSSTQSSNDTGIVMLLRDPTLSAPLSYSAYGRVQRALGTGETVTDIGDVLAMSPSAQGATDLLTEDYSLWSQETIDGIASEYVVAFSPTTANQTVRSVIEWKEFG